MSLSEVLYTVVLKPAPLRAMTNACLKFLIRNQTTVHGAKICLNPGDPVVSGALNLGAYEREEIRFFVKHFTPGMTFVDIGANVGLYSALAIRHGAGCVLSMEPMPENFAFLEKTIAANSPSCPVTLEQAAAGRESGELTLHLNPENKGDNRLYPDALLKDSVTVSVKKLDDVCRRLEISKIDFLKIDVQGAEMLVLEGAEKTLKNSPSCIIMTEFWPDGLKKCGTNPGNYLQAFADLGFQIRELRHGKLLSRSAEELIASTPGRKYINLIAFGSAVKL
jgi:FkbM family methyltransferase